MKNQIILIFAFVFFCACSTLDQPVSVNQPTLADYTVGEKWVWKYKGVSTEGEVRSEGTDTRKIILSNGILGITIDQDTIPVSEIVKKDVSKTPKYAWPLEVGKKWKYESNWTSQDGTTGSQRQNAKIISYQEETVAAGTFMAFTIVYIGKTTNSRGYHADEKEIWLYAPAIKNFIKLTQNQGDFHYEEELIEYSKPQ